MGEIEKEIQFNRIGSEDRNPTSSSNEVEINLKTIGPSPSSRLTVPSSIKSKMANWKGLPRDLLISIAERLPLLEDFAVFGAVCKSWGAAATKENYKGVGLWQKIPSLMLAGKEYDGDYREFYSLWEDKIVSKIYLPETKGKKCMDAGFGWFFTVGEDGDGEASLVNPFTRDQIQLPHQRTTAAYEEQAPRYDYNFYNKAVLSSSPCENPSDFVLVVAGGGSRLLLIWRPGDNLWTRIWDNESSYYQAGGFYDVVLHKGNFYGVNCNGVVVFCDTIKNELILLRRLKLNYDVDMYYIVGGSTTDTLQIIARNGPRSRPIQTPLDNDKYFGVIQEEDSVYMYGTDNFRVFEFDLVHNTYTEIQDLGDRALFLGYNVSIAIDPASKFLGIKANHIYYTDDFWETYLDAEKGGGRDMGVYDLKDGSITKHFTGQSLSFIDPPTWFMPCASCMSSSFQKPYMP